MKPWKLGLALALGMLCGSGCGGSGGGSSPQGPSSVPTPPPDSLAAGTRVSVVSGEDLRPLADARVILAGREYTSDGAGQVLLGEAVRFGSLVDVVAAGFLSRQTTLRSTGATRFILWPKTTGSGVDEAFTTQIVYTWGSVDPPAEGSTLLVRLREGTTQAVVSMSQEIVQDDAAHQAHVTGVEALNAWIGGRVRYSLSSTPPSSGLVFQARIDPSAEDCAKARAFFDGRFNARGEITGGEIVYCGLDVARTGTVTHELGHSVGLQHSYGRRQEVMAPFFSRSRSTAFSEREGLVMNLLFERRAGNAFPDSDRSLAAAAAPPARRIRCP